MAESRWRPYEGADAPDDGQQWGGMFVPYGTGWEIPTEFEFNNDGHGGGPFRWRLFIKVIEGVPRCVGIFCVPYEGEYIAAADLRRLPLGQLIEDAVTWLGRPATDDFVRPENITLEEARELKSAVTDHFRRTSRRPRGNKPPSADDLQKVAEIYRNNIGKGSPTQAVADQMPLTRSTAGRWVGWARDRGFLGPALGPRPGEKKEGNDV